MARRSRFALSVGMVGAVCAWVAGCGDEDDGARRAAATGGAAGAAGAAGGGAGGAVGSIDDFTYAPKSCSFSCPADACAESEVPYECPAARPWESIPHAPECPAWDGTFPSPEPGRCTATLPTGDAAKYAGPDPDAAGQWVLPDGRVTRPSGAYSVFTEADLEGDQVSHLILVPGTRFALAVSTGSERHGVRAIDVQAVGTPGAVTSHVAFPKGTYVNSGVAFVAPDLVLVAGDGKLEALSFDTATGQLARDEARSIPLPPNPSGSARYASGVAVSPVLQRVAVGSVTAPTAVVLDVTPGATYGAVVSEIEVGANESFGVWFDPFDPEGRRAWISLWGARRVAEIDVGAAPGGAATRSVDTDKSPQGIAFLDARWMVVGNGLGETLTFIDRIAGTSTAAQVEWEPGLRGQDLSSLAWDATRGVLYGTMSGINAVSAWNVDLSGGAPALSLAGRLPTGWWPSAVAVSPAGDVAVASLRGNGPGPVEGGQQERPQRGAVQWIARPDTAALQAGADAVERAVQVHRLPGAPAIDCPAGAADFPVPATNEEGPSPRIEYVLFVVRENKTYDALFGDLPGASGNPSLTLKSSTDEMERVFGNTRSLARDFTNLDNSYNDADASKQGHAWTTHGRTTDYCERNWANDVREVAGCAVGDISRPDEGSVFDWLGAHAVPYGIFGEVVGLPSPLPSPTPVDLLYPGGAFQNIGYPDTEKACHLAARARVLCNLPRFSYVTFPNDHGLGLSPSSPTPELMNAVNDEATGLLVAALSRSPLWAKTLVIITEDDPQQGGDSVDYHRVPTVLVSPWVKRGYVSRTHVSASSLHKLVAHLFGLPYPNVQVQNAALPLDAFTSTPDYSPWSYQPHGWPLGCAVGATAAEQALAELWRYEDVDDQPGIDAQMVRWMRGQQRTELTDEERAALARVRARGGEGDVERRPAAGR
ncbi:MAG: hypothetical protein IT376_11780 [Polyangiaceae bacterium]|nr:hypothetical protein [Polyangiaceae bacterium]